MPRPRTVSLPPEDMVTLGEEMLEWVETNDPIHLSQWYSLKKGFTDAQWRVMKDAPEFSTYYEQALKMVGYKYLIKDSPIEPSLKQRWQRVYFKDLRDEENETAKYNATLNTVKEENPEFANQLAKFMVMLDQASGKSTGSKIDLNSSDTIIKAENKS
jgi:hypothetical protein